MPPFESLRLLSALAPYMRSKSGCDAMMFTLQPSSREKMPCIWRYSSSALCFSSNRSPYGGLQTITPPVRVSRSFWTGSTRQSSMTPAFFACFLQSSIECGSISLPDISTVSRRTLSLACSRAAANALFCKKCQSSAANSRLIPGAILFAIIAASIGIVPEPHIGSMSGRVCL